jgi:hypothetical protein
MTKKKKTKCWQERREERINKLTGSCLSVKQYYAVRETFKTEPQRRRSVQTAAKQILKASFRKFHDTDRLADALPVKELHTIIADYAFEFDPHAFEEELYFHVALYQYSSYEADLHEKLTEALKKTDPVVKLYLSQRLEQDQYYFMIGGRCNRSACYRAQECKCGKPLLAMDLNARAMRHHLAKLQQKRKRQRRRLTL